MKVKHVDCTNLFRFKDVETYMDIIDSIEEDVVLQVNKMHFVLEEAVDRYECKAVHLARNPADCFLVFAEIFSMYSKDLTKNYDWWIPNIHGFVDFFIKQYEAMVEKFNAPRSSGFLDRFLIVWTYANFHAVNQVDGERIIAASLEEITEGKGVEKFESFSGLKFDAGMIRRERVFLSTDGFRDEVRRRMKELGL